MCRLWFQASAQLTTFFTSSVWELHAFLVEMLSKFEYTLECSPGKIRKENVSAMCPTLEGEAEKGAQLPVRIRMAPRDV